VSLLRRRGGAERPPRPGRGLLLRAALGGVLIVALAAGATATAGLLEIKQEIAPFQQSRAPHIKAPEITPAEAGKPQTILILGSDKRWQDRHDPARSDTVMLLRLDPHQPATTLLSLPRDLKVTIPGHGLDKINDAYALGGPALTLATVKAFTGLTINHVVNVQFKSFRRVVDRIGCVYLDVDRRYVHSNKGVPIGQRYSAIDLQPGYQKLCGSDALAYVRYRHTDSDIVRGARQQNLLRAVKDQVSASSLFGDREKLIRIFADNTQTDAALASTTGVLRILKLALFSAGHPIRQVQFPATFAKETLPGGAVIDYVTASPAAVQRTVHDFLHPPTRAAQPPAAQLTKRSKRPGTSSPRVPGLVPARDAGTALVAGTPAARSLGLPLYVPSRMPATSRYPNADGLRVYTLRDRANHPHRAYRLVIVASELDGQYWGVQGMDWRTPPILQAKHTSRIVHGRRLDLYRDGSRLRQVAWRTPVAVYWVSNTLSLKLTNAQMLEIASTLARRGHRR
jgi:polyisoprenyl-teichoic acid--peptidoglycan teichoic acid transferase